jgi:hypothetical protein
MSFVATVLAEMWFVHKCTIEPLVQTGTDEDNQATYGWGSPIVVASSRLEDLSVDEIITAAESGVMNVTSKLLVPKTIEVPIGAKVTDVKTNGVGWLATSTDFLEDAGPFEVRSVEVARSQTDEYRQCLLRRIG